MIALTHFSPPAVTSIHYVWYLFEENKLGSSVSEIRCNVFTENNLRVDHSSLTLKALVLHLRRTLIFFLNYFTSFIKNKKYNIENNFVVT